jgi:hypothetical protein
VGRFGTDTLVASSAALASGSATNDSKYVAIDEQLSGCNALLAQASTLEATSTT